MEVRCSPVHIGAGGHEGVGLVALADARVGRILARRLLQLVARADILGRSGARDSGIGSPPSIRSLSS
jgi:hypothetical protein